MARTDSIRPSPAYALLIARELGENGAGMSSTEQVPMGVVAAAISSATVKLLHEYTGRGPTKARTYMDDDLVTVVLQDTLTMGERSLVRDSKADLVLTSRRAFQQTMSSQLIAAVERHSGRKVRAFMSDNHIDPDFAVETFVLEPSLDGATSEG